MHADRLKEVEQEIADLRAKLDEAREDHDAEVQVNLRLREALEYVKPRIETTWKDGEEAWDRVVEVLAEPLSCGGRVAQAKNKVVEAAQRAQEAAANGGEWIPAVLAEALDELDRVQKEGEGGSGG